MRLALRAVSLIIPVCLVSARSSWGWERTISRRGGNGAAYALSGDASGDVVAAGSNGTSGIVVKLRGHDGDIVWLRESPKDEHPGALVVSDAGIYVTIGHFDSEAGRSRLELAKLAGVDGAIEWTAPLSGQDATLAIDAAGELFVSSGDASGGPLTTMKVSAIDGTTRWSHTEPAAFSTAIIVDGAGDVVVGSSPIAKLAGSNGEPIWTANVPGKGIREVILHSNGNVVAVGTTRTGRRRNQIVALSAATGRTLWRTSVRGESIAPFATARLGDVLVSRPAPFHYPIVQYQEHVEALHGRTGTVRWSFGIPKFSVVLDVIADAQHPYVLSTPFGGGAGQYESGVSVLTKNDGRTGRKLWRRAFVDPGFTGLRMAIDRNGRLLVGGYKGSNGVTQFTVMSVSSATGDD